MERLSRNIREEVKSLNQLFDDAVDTLGLICEDFVECDSKNILQKNLQNSLEEIMGMKILLKRKNIIVEEAAKQETLDGNELQKLLKVDKDGIKRSDLKKNERYLIHVQRMIEAGLEENEIHKENEEDDDDLQDVEFTLFSKKSTNCPLSQRELKKPVMNTGCKHTFSFDQIELYLENETKTCPIPGCKSKISKLTLIKDHESQRRIDLLKKKIF